MTFLEWWVHTAKPFMVETGGLMAFGYILVGEPIAAAIRWRREVRELRATEARILREVERELRQ